MLRNRHDTYGLVAVILHWLVALVVVGLFGLGLWMVELTYYDDWYRSAPAIHKGVGVLLFIVTGDFSFHGVTQPVTLEVEQIGAGPDPWGGFRRGFQGSTRFALKDFGIDYDLSPASQVVEIILSIEGVRQDG